MIRAVLFDMDDTLLDIDLGAFVAKYIAGESRILGSIARKSPLALGVPLSRSYLAISSGKRNDDLTNGRLFADTLENLVALHGAETIAAVMVEPVAGSTGVLVPPVGYLQRLREICTAHDILLIFDEVISGFGRSGAWTGAEAFGVTPDLLTFAKQVSNGVQPLASMASRSRSGKPSSIWKAQQR